MSPMETWGFLLLIGVKYQHRPTVITRYLGPNTVARPKREPDSFMLPFQSSRASRAEWGIFVKLEEEIDEATRRDIP